MGIKQEEILKKVGKVVAEERIKETEKSKYKMEEPVRFKIHERYYRCYVIDIIAVQAKIETRYYYDLQMLEPLVPGSAHLHKLEGIAQSQLSK